MTDVLILNAAYQPICVVPWRKAITKLFSENIEERVEIVSTYPDRVIRSAHVEHPMPSVVRHVKFNKQKSKGIKFSRSNVWARDRGRCQYCNLQVPLGSYTYDHVFPKSRGGQASFDNIVTSCAGCNGRKAGRTPAEARMKLLSTPKRPTSLPKEFKRSLTYKTGMPDEWKGWFTGEQYWHGENEESPE